MSNYSPKTEEQIIKEGLLPNGTYDSEVAEAIDKPSKAGNPMITLKLNVFDENGAMRVIFDYIVPSTNFGERKLRHAANAYGLIEKYEAGTVWADDFAHQFGRIEVGMAEAKDGYPARNIITDYIGRDEATAMQESKKVAPKAKTEKEIDDTIPF